MIVALGALDGEAEDALADGVHAVEHGFHAELFGIDAAFLVDHRVAQEAGGDDLILRGMRQQIAGDLLDDELVVRQVAVERVDDPIAIEPDEPRLVLFEAVGIGIARRVEPEPAPALAVMRRGEQAIDLLLVGVGTAVGKEGSRPLSRVGGRPIRSRLARRSSVARSASGEGFKLARSSRSRTNASTGLRTQSGRLVRGAAGRTGGTKAQCFLGSGSLAADVSGQAAPLAIQRRTRSIFSAVSGWPPMGMRVCASAALRRWTRVLFAGIAGHDNVPAGLDIEAQAGHLHLGPVAAIARLGKDRLDLAREVDVPCRLQHSNRQDAQPNRNGESK